MSKPVAVKNLILGGGAPVSVQTMTTAKAEQVEATVAQILAAEQAGAHLVRFAVSNAADANAIPAIKAQTHAALVADIQRDFRLAVLAVDKRI